MSIIHKYNKLNEKSLEISCNFFSQKGLDKKYILKAFFEY